MFHIRSRNIVHIFHGCPVLWIPESRCSICNFFPHVKKQKNRPAVSSFKGCPRVPVPPFFHPLLRTGWCSAAACLPSPSVMDGGMAASTWTRAPFCEVWGKPESCRTLQEFIRWHNYMHAPVSCQDAKPFICLFRSLSHQFSQGFCFPIAFFRL